MGTRPKIECPFLLRVWDTIIGMDIRPSPIAGTWYPGDPAVLKRTVQNHLENAPPNTRAGDVIGIIVPHAGYQYSGAVAGHAFRCLKGLKPEIVAVLSPYHASFSAPLITTGHEGYETPLGKVPVARKEVAELDLFLRTRLGYGLTPVWKDPEHSLEIELPFLQEIFGEFELLPVMIRSDQADTLRELGYALAEILGKRKSVLVASTDLSHFYPLKRAQAFDREMLRRIEAFDPAAVLRAEAEGLGFACGRGAVAAMLWASKRLGGKGSRF